MKKLLNKIRKYRLLSCMLLIAVIIGGVAAKSNVGATSYVYDFWKNIIPSSEGITYKETYYNKDIVGKVGTEFEGKNLFDLGILTKTEESVTDMEVFNGNIYLLELANETVTLPSSTTSFQMSNVGKLIKINQDFQIEEIRNEFLISDEVKAKFDEFYHFDTPLDKITAAQVNSSEFVTVYAANNENQTVSEKEVVFKEFAFDSNNKNVTLELIANDVKIDPSEYSTEIIKEKVEVNNGVDGDGNPLIKEEERSYTKVKFNNASYDGVDVFAKYRGLETPGRAPYAPYSKDITKAAVKLRNPQGVTVTDDAILIADTDNSRILKLDHNFVVVDVYLTPADSTFYQIYGSAYETEFGTAYETIMPSKSDYFTKLSSGIEFKPQKIAINKSGVCYCISKNVYQGLVEFGANTAFNRFVGKNIVATNALKQLWQNIWTEEQYASQALDLPAMFNNISISPDGFLYATANPDSEATQSKNLVQVINAKGNDIMRRNGYVTPDGDAVYITTSNDKEVIKGPSVLTGVAISNTGNFTVCDQKRGRLFTYDAEGNLLYITGEQPAGSQTAGSGSGLSHSIVDPIAVDYLYRTNYKNEVEETIVVLDKASKSIILFETTEFGLAVNQATYLYQNGVISDTYKTDENGKFVLDEDGNKIVISEGAESYWRRVIKMNTNYELAYLGIGKALNLRGEYKEAMKYFELAHNATYYSKAFSSYRDQVLNENFNLLMTVVLVFIGGVVVKYVLNIVNEKNKQNIMKGEDE